MEEYNDEVQEILKEDDMYESGNAESHNTSNAEAVFKRRCADGGHSSEACDMAWNAKKGGGEHAVKKGKGLKQDPAKFNSKGDMDEETVEISIQEYSNLLGLAKTWKNKRDFIEQLEKREKSRIESEKAEITDFLVSKNVSEDLIKKAKTLCDLKLMKETVESQIPEVEEDDFEVQQVNNARLLSQLATATEDFDKEIEEARKEAYDMFFPNK